MSERGRANHPFDGTWRIDTEHSLVWDDERRRHVPDLVGDEVITMSTVDGVQDYEVLYGDSPRIRMGYACRFDDTEWSPYVVRGMDLPDDVPRDEAIGEFKKRIHAADGHRERQFEIGRCYALVRLVSVDDRTHYRVSRDPVTRLAHSILLRRMAEDGDSYLTTVMDLDGIAFRIRRFVRVG